MRLASADAPLTDRSSGRATAAPASTDNLTKSRRDSAMTTNPDHEASPEQRGQHTLDGDTSVGCPDRFLQTDTSAVASIAEDRKWRPAVCGGFLCDVGIDGRRDPAGSFSRRRGKGMGEQRVMSAASSAPTAPSPPDAIGDLKAR